MTTNQTIDGVLVPRDLALRILGCISYEEADELRALLDVSLTDEGEKLAVQPQGEPVAWLVQCRSSGLVEQAEPNEKATNPTRWTDAFPVYREQPAPVAVDDNVEFEKWWMSTPILRKQKIQVAQEAWFARANLSK